MDQTLSKPLLLYCILGQLTQHSAHTNEDVYYEIRDIGPDPAAPESQEEPHYYSEIDKRRLPPTPNASGEQLQSNYITASVTVVADNREENE